GTRAARAAVTLARRRTAVGRPGAALAGGARPLPAAAVRRADRPAGRGPGPARRRRGPDRRRRGGRAPHGAPGGGAHRFPGGGRRPAPRPRHPARRRPVDLLRAPARRRRHTRLAAERRPPFRL
ncbi:MAG: hypothetical protein AVDCRST_MAG07-1098, partial [uncultured Frankineae bacterium]